MKIIYDDREKIQKITEILSEFQGMGIETERKRIDYGDYVKEEDLTKKGYTIVDRKGGGLTELALNLGKNFSVFKEKLKRARKNHVVIVILIADESRNRLEDVKDWEPKYNTRGKRNAMTGEKLYQIMNTQSKYYSDCLRYEFVKKEHMAKRITEILE